MRGVTINVATQEKPILLSQAMVDLKIDSRTTLYKDLAVLGLVGTGALSEADFQRLQVLRQWLNYGIRTGRSRTFSRGRFRQFTQTFTLEQITQFLQEQNYEEW